MAGSTEKWKLVGVKGSQKHVVKQGPGNTIRFLFRKLFPCSLWRANWVWWGHWYDGAGLGEPNYYHFFPTPGSVISCWKLSLSHGEHIYTTVIGKCYKSGLFPLPEYWLLTIYQHTSKWGTGWVSTVRSFRWLLTVAWTRVLPLEMMKCEKWTQSIYFSEPRQIIVIKLKLIIPSPYQG